MNGCYRWVVLGAGVLALAVSAAVQQGLPALAPQLRHEYGLGLTGIGVLLASVTVGLMSTLVLWGALADRYGDRLVMTIGLLLTAGTLVAASRAGSVGPLVGWLVLAGAAAASANAASGRAALAWFGRSQRGVAMGIRQTAMPLGAGLAAAALPPLAMAHGLDAAFLALGGGCVLGALVVLTVVRQAPSDGPRALGGPSPVADPRIRRLAVVALLLVVPQFTVVAFLVVYLVDEHDVRPATAALLLAAVQLGGGASRIVVGWWSDRLRLRVGPLHQLACCIAWLFTGLTVLELLDVPVVVPLLLLCGVVAISWNGLAYTAVGEVAGPAQAGAALGLQNTSVALGVALTAPLVGAVVDRTAWAAGFAVAASCAAVAALQLREPARAENPRKRADAG